MFCQFRAALKDVPKKQLMCILGDKWNRSQKEKYLRCGDDASFCQGVREHVHVWPPLEFCICTMSLEIPVGSIAKHVTLPCCQFCSC